MWKSEQGEKALTEVKSASEECCEELGVVYEAFLVNTLLIEEPTGGGVS